MLNRLSCEAHVLVKLRNGILNPWAASPVSPEHQAEARCNANLLEDIHG